MTTILQPLSNLVYELQGVPFIDIRDQLPVNPHYTWEQLAGVRRTEALNTLVCHHDAIPKVKSAKYTDLELARRIAIDHINSKKNHPNGDAGFPYDVWIRNGNIYWTNPLEPREYGVAGNNGYTVNVCVSGDYSNGVDTMTPEDRKALYAAILMVKQSLPAAQYIKGHGEIVPTRCPGYDMNEVREEIMRMEMDIEKQKMPEYQAEVALKIANQILFMKNLFEGGKLPNGEPSNEGQRKWAIANLMKMEPEMKRLGLLK